MALIADLLERILPNRRWVIAGIHVALVTLAYLLAFLVRFEFHLAREQWELFLHNLPILLAARLAAFAWFHLYEGLWRYVSMRDIVMILKAVTLSSLVFSAGVLTVFRQGFPGSVLILDWVLCLALVGGIRLSFRAIRESSKDGRGRGRRALVVGAGDAGEMLVREIERNPTLQYEVVGFVDDDPGKRSRRLHGREVLGAIGELPGICLDKEVQELLIAIPSASGQQMRRIIGACRATGVEFKTIPNMRELLDSPVQHVKVRRVNIEDLLRREPVRIAHAEIEKFLCGKRVLVTGGGGSIGAELCRQVARFAPAALILLDQSENGLFFVEMELRDKFPQLGLHPVIGDVTDKSRMTAVFDEHRPQIVFHAAAHKHVPLMEVNKTEAVKNNVLGTRMVATMASRYGIEDFVMISTDKAVRPSSVMGATKRLAEMYVLGLNTDNGTRFMAVRFGNVLASEGSVLQVFQRQIEAGGPVTITHPEMKRYFMTIPEASQLVLQAATQGKGGEIFVLDMGEPVRIVDLAKDLIALSGLDPERDIEIKFVGPRPGEKIFEELMSPETRILPTAHEKIMVVETDRVDHGELERAIRELLHHVERGEEEAVVSMLKVLVPDYECGGMQLPAAAAGLEHRILLVQHDAYTRTTLKRLLESKYRIYEVVDRQHAVRVARECKPDLVILDLDLPGANIRRMCSQLREGDGCVPILIVTGSAEAASLEQVRKLGADDRVYRPIPVNILETRVKRLLDTNRGAREA
jgi:FlaA1/EpsC-like NDP-sugar epimerase/ActR/RegA family two-component response regulator